MAEPDPIRASLVPRLAFSTDQLPAGLDDDARFRLWRDFQEEYIGSFDITYTRESPFWVRIELAQFGVCGIAQYSGALARVNRTKRDVALDGKDQLVLGLNLGRSPVLLSHRGSGAVLDPGSVTLMSYSDAGRLEFQPGLFLLEVSLPRPQLLQLIRNADDLVAQPLDHDQPATRHLMRYLGILLGSNGVDDDPLLSAHVETTLLDLVALTLGAGRDQAYVSAMRGLRAARLAEVLAEIKARFADAAFSVGQVAKRLGLSPRYVQTLLHETGETFTERVYELRLQKARSMLASPLYRDTQVGQIAYACGFNQVSHFNHCFRRRFGLSPTAARGGARFV